MAWDGIGHPYQQTEEGEEASFQGEGEAIGCFQTSLEEGEASFQEEEEGMANGQEEGSQEGSPLALHPLNPVSQVEIEEDPGLMAELEIAWAVEGIVP